MVRQRTVIDKDAIGKFLEEGRGKGTGVHYKPWLSVRDVPSQGVVTRDKGWKTGRLHHLLSNLEGNYFCIAEWSSSVIDIREQYPLLPIDETLSIAQSCEIQHPLHPVSKQPIVLTTDFLLTVSIEGKQVDQARAVKPSSALSSRRTLEKLELERRFWVAKGVDWGIVTERDIPQVLVKNVHLIHKYRQLPAYTSREILCRVVPLLTKLIGEKPLPLRDLTVECDERLGLEGGTSLSVAYYLIATRQWHIDMNVPIKPSLPLVLLYTSLHDYEC